MIWNDVFGLLLTMAGLALFVWAWRRHLAPAPLPALHPGASVEPNDTEGTPGAAVHDELAQRLARRVRHDRSRRERLAWCGIGLMVMGWLIAITPGFHRAWSTVMASASESAPARSAAPGAPAPLPQGSFPPSAPPRGLAPAAPSTSPPLSPAAVSEEHLALWPLATGGIAAMLVGGVVMVLGRATWVRAAGAVTLLSGLTANGSLVKEVKVSDIFNFETKIDKPTLEIELNRRLQQLSEFGPEQLALLDGFTPGDATLLAHMKAPLQGVCERWRTRGGREQRGLILVVGSTDRVALSPAARVRYESNVGLARARAEQAKARLVECDIPPSQLMTLVSGPRNTPVDRPASAAEPGFAEDRSVAVWALWSVPARLKP